MHRVLLLAPALVAASVALAAAQDHLVCYKVKDPLRLKGPAPAWLSLDGSQFGAEECRVVGGFRLFCVPAEKTVTAPIQRKIAPAPYEPFTPSPMAGLGEQDRHCYKIKCTGSAAPPSVVVADQFATRPVAPVKPFLLCGPAQKVVGPTTTVPPGTTTSTTTPTTSTTSTTAPSCCAAGGFLSVTTQFPSGADGGDVLRSDGTPLPDHPNLLVGGLYLGGGGQSSPLPHQVPDLMQLVTEITGLTGCAATLGPATSAETGTNRNCTAPGCFVGAPLAIPNATVPAISLCLVSRVASPGASGTSHCCGGAVDLTLPLAVDVYLAGDQDPGNAGIQPCPLCEAATCVGGANDGMPCVAATTVLGDAYPTSQDCPPAPGLLATTLPLTPVLTTGTVSRTGTNPANGGGSLQQRAFCGYCRDIDTGLFESPARQCWENGMAVGAACGGVFETCEQRGNGAFGPNGATAKTITAIGTVAAGICGPQNAALATVLCLPPTFDATIDAGYDLPGPAAAVVPVTTQFCPVASPCP